MFCVINKIYPNHLCKAIKKEQMLLDFGMFKLQFELTLDSYLIHWLYLLYGLLALSNG